MCTNIHNIPSKTIWFHLIIKKPRRSNFTCELIKGEKVSIYVYIHTHTHTHSYAYPLGNSKCTLQTKPILWSKKRLAFWKTFEWMCGLDQKADRKRRERSNIRLKLNFFFYAQHQRTVFDKLWLLYHIFWHLWMKNYLS